MLNPWLESHLFTIPVQRVLVEVDVNRVNETLGALTGIRLPQDVISSTNKFFGFIALNPVSPELIQIINRIPAVKIVHGDIEKRIVQMPVPGTDWWPTSVSRLVMEAEDAVRRGFTGEMQKLGVCDTGIDPNHPQLAGAEWYSEISWPFREMFDKNGHGSHVCSTAAGALYNSPAGIVVEGVSRARLVSVKCLGRGVGTGFTSEIVNAISTCWNKGCQIISMSLGSSDGEPQGGPENDPEWRVIRALTRKGAIFVIAAGNSGPNPDTIGNPGSCPEAITVAAIDMQGKVADFSSRGGRKFPSKPDVAAPGNKIYSGTSRISPMGLQQPQAGLGYVAISGTSMSTPHVSGLIALLKHQFPGMTAQQFKEVMARKGHVHDNETGWGIPTWSMFQ